MDDGVEALAIVVDDPPRVAQAVLPSLKHRLGDVAFVEFCIAEKRNHPAFRRFRTPVFRADVILHKRRKQRLRDAEPDRSSGKIDAVGILGARGIGLCASICPELLQSFFRLAAKKILNGVEDRPSVRLHRDAVFGPQNRKIKRRHDGRRRGAGCLVTADLEPVVIVPQVIGVVDHPRRQPKNFAFKLLKHFKL